MSENNKQYKPSRRLDKFLFYAKFVVLIIIAVLFIIAYSYSYRDFPVSTTQYEFTERYTNPDINSAKILVVMDYKNLYSNDSFTQFYLLKNMLSDIGDYSFDMILTENNAESFTVLNNINEGLLLRVYQKEQYSYIVSIGDGAIAAAKEIRELFFPKSQILLYGVSSKTMESTLTPVNSVNDSVLSTFSASNMLNPSSEKMVFLCDNSSYSEVIMHIVENRQDESATDYEVLSTNEYSLSEAIDYINKNHEKMSVFYVSFESDADDEPIVHSEIINRIQANIDSVLYDLSPIEDNEEVRNAIRYYPLESSDKPLAYLGLSPQNANICGYELIEYAAANIKSANQYSSISSFVGNCMNKVGFDRFPTTLQEQVDFCYDNSLIISKEELHPGDLIFTSTNGNEGTIDSVAVYVNQNIIISVNSLGILCFTKPENSNTHVAYAHPYSYLYCEETETN